MRTRLALLAITLGMAPAYAETVAEFIERNDADGNGQLTVDELELGGIMDADGDGIVTTAELTAIAARASQSTPFHWVNPLPEGHGLPVQHATFESALLGHAVGYCIYLPPDYSDAGTAMRYPVVYYLHGGRPGNETRSVGLARHLDAAMRSGAVPPAIYVFVNGGAVSHYNYPQEGSPAVDVFLDELIPHVDTTYRTMAHRGGRALQGFSQGGRGVTRIMFGYPELFSSAAPGGPGYATEKQIDRSGGVERDDRIPGGKELVFAPDENAYARARAFVRGDHPPLPILIWVGTEGFNYVATREYMGFLDGLEIPYERLIVPGAQHNPNQIYEAAGLELMRFHARHFDGG